MEENEQAINKILLIDKQKTNKNRTNKNKNKNKKQTNEQTKKKQNYKNKMKYDRPVLVMISFFLHVQWDRQQA
jgi:hypothetical protein